MSCCRAVLALSVALSAAAAAADEPVRASIAVVLDCSASMGLDAVGSGDVQEVSDADDSRFEAARDMARDLLRQLAADGHYQVGFWLYGHRLKWEGEGEPQLVENTEYLGLTDGFAILSQLVPGDDVEVVHRLGRLDDSGLDPILARLDAAQAFGESPLYLAMTGAIQALAADDHAAPKGLIVITSGENKQWVARSRRTKEDVLRAVANQPHLPIHFISFGPKPDAEAAAEMRALAEATGGSVAEATLEGVLAKIENTGSSVQSASAGGPPVRNVTGRVLYYKKPVAKARVNLVGSGLPPVQTDTTGTFLFQGVLPGSYTVHVEGIAKNMIRTTEMPLSVPAPPREMQGLTLELP